MITNLTTTIIQNNISSHNNAWNINMAIMVMRMDASVAPIGNINTITSFIIIITNINIAQVYPTWKAAE